MKTSNLVRWNHPLLKVLWDRNDFVGESANNGWWRVYDKNGDMLREEGNRLVTNNGTEYYLFKSNPFLNKPVLTKKQTKSRKVKVLYNNGVRFVARIPKPHVDEILNFYSTKEVFNRRPTYNNKTHAMHINAKNIRLGNISSNRQLAFLVNPESEKKRISSAIFYPSARANAPGARLLKHGRGRLRDRKNQASLQTHHPHDLKENLNRYKCNINNFRTQLEPGDGILFNYNIPHSIPWFETNSRRQNFYRVGGNTRNQIIQRVRKKHLETASNFI